MAIGLSFSDVTDAVSDVATSVVDKTEDVVSSIVSVIPGGDPLASAMADLVRGPLRDFANTAIGHTVLIAISTAFYQSIAWTLGPQLASVAFAIPGLFQGSDFEDAWFQGVKERSERTAQILGVDASQVFNSQITDALNQLAANFDPTTLIPDDVKNIADIAKRFGLQEYVTAAAVAIWDQQTNNMVNPDDYDLASGKHKLTGVQTATAMPNAIRTASITAATRPAIPLSQTALPAVFQSLSLTDILNGKSASTPTTSAPAPAPIVTKTAQPVAQSNSLQNAAIIGGVAVGLGALYWWSRN